MRRLSIDLKSLDLYYYFMCLFYVAFIKSSAYYICWNLSLYEDLLNNKINN